MDVLEGPRARRAPTTGLIMAVSLAGRCATWHRHRRISTAAFRRPPQAVPRDPPSGHAIYTPGSSFGVPRNLGDGQAVSLFDQALRLSRCSTTPPLVNDRSPVRWTDTSLDERRQAQSTSV